MAEILVIEDDDLTRSFIKTVLESDGHRVRSAGDGMDGLMEFKRIPADLVICDLIMPVRDGVTTIGELLELAPGLPVIAITGGGADCSQHQLLAVAKSGGACRTLAKPFAPPELLAAVGDALRGGAAG